MWVGWVALHSVAQKGMKGKSERIEARGAGVYNTYKIETPGGEPAPLQGVANLRCFLRQRKEAGFFHSLTALANLGG